MKINLLIIFLTSLMPFMAFSQKNDISSGVLYTPVGYGDRVLCISLSYYRNISSKSSIGISVDLGQYFEKYDKYYENEYGRKDYASIVSLNYKNNFYNEGRSSLYYGTGILYGFNITYYEIIPQTGYCGVGLPENWEPPETGPVDHWNYDEYFSGLSANFECRYRLVDNFHIGATLKTYILYSFNDNMFFPGILPLVIVGYKW